jgi:hypothetical protein
MKITVWLLTRERATWITGAETLGILLVVLTATGGLTRLMAVALLAHVSYKALTSLPMGQVPGRPDGAKAVRRNQDLRSRVVGFLNEIRRAEDYAHQATVGGRPRADLERDIAWARKRMMAAAAEVAKTAGRPAKVDRASLGSPKGGEEMRAYRGAHQSSEILPRVSPWDTPQHLRRHGRDNIAT